MKLALNWLADSSHTGTVLICSDSQAVLRAIGSCSESVFDIVSILGKPKLSRTILQWVPGHCGIPGNELADQKAEEASRLNTTVSLPSAVSCIKQNILEPEVQHSQMAAVYADHSEQRDRCNSASRKHATLLAQVRSGHCIHLQTYKHLMDNTVDPNCPRCGQAPQNTGSTALALYMHDWKFSLPLKHFLCPHSQLFRASRLHWQDILCDDLVRTPSTTAAAATAATITTTTKTTTSCHSKLVARGCTAPTH